jgi:hypothetical protein
VTKAIPLQDNLSVGGGGGGEMTRSFVIAAVPLPKEPLPCLCAIFDIHPLRLAHLHFHLEIFYHSNSSLHIKTSQL